MNPATFTVQADGACRNNDNVDAVATIGVYFGESSKYNISRVLQLQAPTSQQAELIAGIRALEQIFVYGNLADMDALGGDS